VPRMGGIDFPLTHTKQVVGGTTHLFIIELCRNRSKC
jgi:hypothetical protein